MKATGIVRRIDDLGRVVIPKELRRTMHLREGAALEIFTEKDALLFKKYSPVGELSEYAMQLCDSLKKSANGIAAVCDRDSVIAISGGARRELLDKPISPDLGSIMEGRGMYYAEGACSVPVSSADEKYCIDVAAPVSAEGDVVGCVLFVNERGSAPSGEVEKKLAQATAGFLGAQMEG